MANGCYATYGGVDFDYIQPTIKQDAVFSSEGTLTHYNKTFTFRAFFGYANYAAWNTGRNAIDTALQTSGGTLTIKDTVATPNTMWSFGATDTIGDAPFVRYSYEESMGYNFWVNVEVTGGIPPAGSGSIVDTYTDRYSYDKQDRVTYTRSGTLRNSSAWSTSDAALTAADPAPTPANKWEYLTKDGTLDKDAKELTYNWVYIESFEDLPSGFATLEYSESFTEDGRRRDIGFSANGGVDFDDADVDGLRAKLEDWGKGKLPEGAKVASMSSNLDRRNGTCTLNITATAPVSGDIVAFSKTTTVDRTEDFVIRRRLGGGGSWKQRVGDPITIERVSGTATGLNNYPPGLQGAWDRSSNSTSEPVKGPDGALLYTISFSGEKTIVSGGTPGGGGAGGGSGGSGGGNSPGQAGKVHLVGIGTGAVGLNIHYPSSPNQQYIGGG